ncbi:MAG TPA: formyltransferase family protein, partial [Polyangiaceae bacterium]|nr:formyltransferase family protein [Polyangiaceae bacterium]
MTRRKLALGVLCSGGGTNLQAVLDACAAGALDAEVRVVIANVAGAFALERARAAGVPALCLPHRDHPDRASYDRALAAALRGAGAELVVLAGFMRLVTPALLDAFPRRVINI